MSKNKKFVKGWEWYLATQRPTAEEQQDMAEGAVAARIKPKKQIVQDSAEVPLVAVGQLEDQVKHMRKIKAEGGLYGLSTGYRNLDALIGGLVPGEVIVISGKTSHGKSQLAINIACQLAITQTPVLFITLEQTKLEVADRSMAIYEKLTGEKSLGFLPLFIQAKPDITPEEISDLVAYAQEDGIGLVVIDHVHMWIRGEDATGKATLVSQAIKQLALKHEIPIIALAQLRKTNGKYPVSDDLKDSVVLSQDADVILMVHRPRRDDPGNQELEATEVTVSIQKNRNRGYTDDHSLATLWADGIQLVERRVGMFPGAKRTIR